MRTRRSALAILGLGAHTALSACGTSDSVLRPVARLADLPREGRAGPAAVATLGNVTRTVLLGHPERWIVNARHVVVPPDRHVTLRAAVDGARQRTRSLGLSVNSGAETRPHQTILIESLAYRSTGSPSASSKPESAITPKVNLTISQLARSIRGLEGLDKRTERSKA